jgi:hypothetical protein
MGYGRVAVIGLFARQALHARRGNGGQASVLFLVVAVSLLTIIFASIRLQNLLVARVGCSNAVDAIALSAATWEARSLNMIAALNDGILQCMRAIRWISVVWAALAIAAAFGAGLPAFLKYTQEARQLISAYWDTAHQLAAWSVKIKNAAPYLVLGEVSTLSRKRNVTGILAPMNPRGPHDGGNTLELHLEPGPPLRLAEAILPVSGALNRLKKIRFLKGPAKAVASLLEAALGGLDRSGKGPIRMLVPEKDFLERQYVRYAGRQPVPALPIPFLAANPIPHVSSEAQAEPYGGGSVEMTWKSRLTERSTK